MLSHLEHALQLPEKEEIYDGLHRPWCQDDSVAGRQSVLSTLYGGGTFSGQLPMPAMT